MNKADTGLARELKTSARRHRDEDGQAAADGVGDGASSHNITPAPLRDTGDALDLNRRIAALLPDLRGFARFLTRDVPAADDLVQDTLVRALAARDQFQPDTNLKAWLFTIQRNGFYEQVRRRRRETRVLSEKFPEPESTAPDAALRGDVSDLQRMLFTLPPLLREALVLVGAQELSYEEAALICAVPVGTVKARVSRARSQLSRAMRADPAT